MVVALIKKIFGTRNNREVKRIQVIVEQINILENSVKELSDGELCLKTNEFKSRLNEGETLDDVYLCFYTEL